jgi:hypothetical protein
MNSWISANQWKLTSAVMLSGLAVACGGGGGGSSPAVEPVVPPVVSNPQEPAAPVPALRITEVTAKGKSDGAEGGWFEVYNPNASAVNLADYVVASTAYNNTGNTATSSVITANFVLPMASLPPGGFMVLASKALYFLPDGPQLKYVGSPSLYPSWTANGFIELKRAADASTVDFVRFGNSTATPRTAAQWTGAAVNSLPNGTAAAYGKSIVRLASGNYADTNSAADWVPVNFSTPGGKNDVAPGTVDSDADGVPDSAKQAGGTYAGLDLYAMGARPGKRDIFLEIHVMDQKPGAAIDVNFIPHKEALQKVVDAFAVQNIRLHIDAGARFSSSFDPANFNLGGGNATGSIPFSPCTDLPILPSDVIRSQCSNFFAHKNSNFDVRRRVMFSYNLFANSQETTGLSGSSGFAEIRGNDSMITMGGFPFGTSATATLTAEQNTLRYINTQAATLMHEFGHNLSLRHGGFENTNHKPNYVSVMNYMYQLVGIPGIQNDSVVGDRYEYYVKGLNATTAAARDSCLLINSRCSNSFIIDYSNGSSADLDENALIGTNLIGRGTSVAGSFINWSGTATVASPAYAFNVNRDFTTATPSMPLFGVLRDYNDWANIQLPFVRTLSGFNSGASSDNTARRPASTDAPRRDPMNDAAEKEFVREDPPSPQLLRELQDNVLPGFRIRN